MGTLLERHFTPIVILNQDRVYKTNKYSGWKYLRATIPYDPLAPIIRE